jgi:hypothetical protein
LIPKNWLPNVDFQRFRASLHNAFIASLGHCFNAFWNNIALPVVFCVPHVLTHGRSILLVPSKLTHPIVRAVVSASAVPARATFRLFTLVVEVTTRGAVPLATVDIS